MAGRTTLTPTVYQAVALQLARAVGLSVSNSSPTEDTKLLEKLTNGMPETIERENQRLSADLENDFCNPNLHEQAALLLGAFPRPQVLSQWAHW